MTAVYDNYEISPCRRHEEADYPGRFYFEVCEPSEADVWTLYGHIDGRGVEAIGDFADREAAEQVFSRITGEPFTASYEASPRLRLMHAAPDLLAACWMVVNRWDRGDLAEAARACQAAVELATASGPPWDITENHPIANEPAAPAEDVDLNAPWSLSFERDGTDDVAVVIDAEGEELLRSRPFWLPGSDDPVPPTLAAMRLIVAAPMLLAALEDVIVYAENEAFSLETLSDRPEATAEAERAWKAVESARLAIALPQRHII